MSALAWSSEIAEPNTWNLIGSDAPLGGMVVNICVVNKSVTEPAFVDICITASASAPSSKDFIEEYTRVARGSPLLRTGEPLKEGEKVYARSSIAGVNVRVSGYNKI